MKYIMLSIGIMLSIFGCSSDSKPGSTPNTTRELLSAQLRNKIKGGWDRNNQNSEFRN